MWENSLPSLRSVGISVKKEVIEIPTSLSSSYREDFDILETHKTILKSLENKKLNKGKIEAKITELNKALLIRQTIVDRKDRLRKLEKQKKKLEELSSCTSKYLQEVSPILEEYKKIGPISKVIEFSSKERKTEKVETEEERDIRLNQDELRQKYICLYLEKSRKYFDLNIVWQSPEICCPGCGLESSKQVADEFSSLACSGCGVETRRLAKVPCSTEGGKNNLSRNNYEDKENFIKAMERYQGKQVIKNTKNLFNDLDEYFTSYGMKTGEHIQRSIPLDERGRKRGTSKDLMFKALSERGYSNYYKNINLICHLYWGWTLPDISHLEDGLLDDYDSFQRVYEKHKIGRRSCLSTDYMLLILLIRKGYKCTSDDFKIVKTAEIFEEYEEIRNRVYSELKWDYHSLG